jgi:chromosome segregation ATPase
MSNSTIDYSNALTFENALPLIHEKQEKFEEKQKSYEQKAQETEQKIRESKLRIQEMEEISRKEAKEHEKEMREIRQRIEKIQERIDANFQKFQENHEKFQKDHEKFRQDYEEDRKAYEERQKAYEEERKAEAKEYQERQKVYDEKQKKVDKRLEKLEKSADKMLRVTKNLNRSLGSLSNRFGQLAEHLVAPRIAERFNEFGYHFLGAADSYKIKKDEKGPTIAEIDILLENEKTIALIEVKSKPDIQDIEKHLERIQIARRHFDQRGDADKGLIGAIAGLVFPDDVGKFAIESGLYVIVPNGNTVKIEVPENFKPKIF